MGALFSLIPGKDLFYGVLILGVLCLLSYEVHYLKAEGAARQVAADTKLAAEVTAHNTDLQTAAAKASAALEDQYETDIAATPAAPVPHVLCNRVAPGRNVVPQAAGRSPDPSAYTGPGIQTPSNGGADSIDVGPPLTVAGKNADAQIKALQADVQTLLKEMQGAGK